MKYQTFVIKAILRQNLWFVLPYLLLLLGSSIYLSMNGKGAMVLLLDTHAQKTLDWFFVFYTHLGDGLFALFTVLLFLFINKKQALTLAIGLILSGLLAQLLKHTIGIEHHRPSLFFEGIHSFRDIEYLVRHLHHSMPSGHTASAFCLFFTLALMSEKKTYGYLFFCMALLVGISRMYLAQHFLEDVVAGSFLGTMVALFVYTMANKWFSNAKWNKPLIPVQ